MRFLIIGAGLSGAVIAEQLSKKFNCHILLIDERPHIGGNCFTNRDDSTGIMIHQYGPHIFNTDSKEVWEYINGFCNMMPFINRVKTIYKGQVYSLPINLHTINQFFGKNFSPKEAESFISNLGDKTIIDPTNFEDQAFHMIGKDLYDAFFYGYTKKQWGCEPRELPASILKRLPVRFTYDDNYYTNPFQGIPQEGYTAIFEKMLNHPNIDVKLNTKFDHSFNTLDFDHIFYTGPIDTFFNFKYGRLGYRTVYFKREEYFGDYQGNAVINYADYEIPYTRIHEHKHFAKWENHSNTIIFKEYSKETEQDDIPYYPKRLSSDMEKFYLYQEDAKKLEKYTFLGRLAKYQDMDMHHVINEALDFCNKFIPNY